VRITKADPMSAIIEPIAFNKVPAPTLERLVPNSRAEVAMFDFGDRVLKVAFHPDQRFQGTAAAVVNDALTRLSVTTRGQAERSPAQSADWILSAVGNDVRLAPASGWKVDTAQAADTAAVQGAFRVGEATPAFSDFLAQTIDRVVRARELMKLATAPGASESSVSLQVDLLRYKDANDRVGTPVTVSTQGRVLHAGDRVAFRLTNTGKTAADVTLLFLDSQYGIDPIFPRRDAESDSRLAIKQTVVTQQFTVNADTVGWEHVIAIAVETAPARTDFRYLAQPSLEQVRGDAASRGGRSPLQDLLERAVFGAGATRGLGDSDIGKYAMKMLTWRTEQ
jgi:hypothetical protein